MNLYRFLLYVYKMHESYIVCCMYTLFSNEEFRRCYNAGTAYHTAGRSKTLVFMLQGFESSCRLRAQSKSAALALHIMHLSIRIQTILLCYTPAHKSIA